MAEVEIGLKKTFSIQGFDYLALVKALYNLFSS